MSVRAPVREKASFGRAFGCGVDEACEQCDSARPLGLADRHNGVTSSRQFSSHGGVRIFDFSRRTRLLVERSRR